MIKLMKDNIIVMRNSKHMILIQIFLPISNLKYNKNRKWRIHKRGLPVNM